jgi:hypothetical protein
MSASTTGDDAHVPYATNTTQPDQDVFATIAPDPNFWRRHSVDVIWVLVLLLGLAAIPLLALGGPASW